jgi:2-methylisocitrate lyase-like PEP mutase family enzyme
VLGIVTSVVATLVSTAFSGTLLARWWRRGRRDHPLLLWGVALALFGLASAALALGVTLGWTPARFRAFYLLGGVLNVRRTVRDLEAAGVAALHLEDQQFPRRCGFLGGHQLVPAQEMVVRLKVALEARRCEQTMIIARTEMFGASGVEETIERAARYLEAGADMVFCNGVTSEAQAEQLARAIAGPQIYNVSTSGMSPHLGTKRLRALGYRVVIFPAHALFLALRQIQEMFADLHQHGTLTPWLDRMVDFGEWKRLSGIRDAEAFEQRHASPGHD